MELDSRLKDAARLLGIDKTAAMGGELGSILGDPKEDLTEQIREKLTRSYEARFQLLQDRGTPIVDILASVRERRVDPA